MTDLDPLYLFAQKQEVDIDVWEFVHQLMDFDDVLPVLEEINLELQETADAEQADFAANHTFGAKAA